MKNEQTTTALAPHASENAGQTALAPPREVQLGSLAVSGPRELVSTATEIANELKAVIDRQGLAVNISGRQYVKAEGWCTLAAMAGVVPREVSVHEHEDGGFEAVVELVRASDGGVIGRASAICGMDESKWARSPRYARRSMAVTRATAKACRMAFAWVMGLSGFQPTPFEEMPDDDAPSPASRPQQRREVVADSPPPIQVLGDKGAKRLLARLNTIGKSFDALRIRLKHDDPDTCEAISGVPLEEIPAAAIPAIQQVIQAWEGEASSGERAPHAAVPEDDIPF